MAGFEVITEAAPPQWRISSAISTVHQAPETATRILGMVKLTPKIFTASAT
jgi:hypothetical protein